MSGCCGGDANLAGDAAQALRGLPTADAAPMVGDKLRVEYLGDERGTLTWEPPGRLPISLGNNPMHRFKDITPEEVAWLVEHAVPIRVVPTFDTPRSEPIVQPSAVLLPTATEQALRPPRGRKVPV